MWDNLKKAMTRSGAILYNREHLIMLPYKAEPHCYLTNVILTAT